MKDPKEFVRKLRLCYPIEDAVALIEARDREAKIECLRELRRRAEAMGITCGERWFDMVPAAWTSYVAELESAGTGESRGDGVVTKDQFAARVDAKHRDADRERAFRYPEVVAERDQLRAALRELCDKLPVCCHQVPLSYCGKLAFHVEYTEQGALYFCDEHEENHDCERAGQSWAEPLRKALALLND